MKKIIVLALTLTLALLFSCGKKDAESPYKDYLLFVGKDQGASTIMKLNVHSGSISPLCQDPLCRHTADSGCHFFGAVTGTIYQYGGKLYFQRRYQSAAGVVSYVIGYDPEDQSEKSLYEITGGGGMGFSLGYFWRSYEDENGDKISLRVDLSTGKLETLDENYQRPIGQYGKQFFYPIYDLGGQYGEYLTHGFALGDSDGNISKKYAEDKIIQLVCTDSIEDDIVLFYCPKQGDDGKYDLEDQTLWACDLKTGEEWLVNDNIGDVYFLRDGDSICFANWIDDPPVIGFDLNDNKERYNRTGGKIWRQNIRTGETELFLETGHCLEATSIDMIDDRLLFAYTDTDYDDYTEIDNKHVGIWYDYKETRGWVIINPADGSFTDVVNTADIYSRR